MSAPRLAVDMTRCDGHGICALLFPDLIDLNRYGYAAIEDGELNDKMLRRARRAVAACPEGALTLVGGFSDGAVPVTLGRGAR